MKDEARFPQRILVEKRLKHLILIVRRVDFSAWLNEQRSRHASCRNRQPNHHSFRVSNVLCWLCVRPLLVSADVLNRTLTAHVVEIEPSLVTSYVDSPPLIAQASVQRQRSLASFLYRVQCKSMAFRLLDEAKAQSPNRKMNATN